MSSFIRLRRLPQAENGLTVGTDWLPPITCFPHHVFQVLITFLVQWYVVGIMRALLTHLIRYSFFAVKVWEGRKPRRQV